ncbi:MAG TPA: CO dehydrogenase/acetyl-CoA synthase complex subunit alpha [Methanomicrobiales archaeon]|nr:CO dehydrogenase/acetyl-CoA synthase complex subunit alpha [Methanomicrobiales archaeon]
MKLKVTIDELITDRLRAKGVEFNVGRVIEAWEEEPGPTPMPGIATLRSWDRTLLSKYHPFYLPFCDLCCLCTMGKCDLSGGKRGACGIDMAAQQSRIVLLACAMGAATHAGHMRHLLSRLIGSFGRDHPIDVGSSVLLEAPHARLVTGIKPKTLGDLEDIAAYCEGEITQLLSCCHTGQEGDPLDLESKVLHAGMIDHVALEGSDLAQISAYSFPKGEAETPLVECGPGCLDPGKPVILVIGHNVPPAIAISDAMREMGVENQIEVCGICCTALDLTRYNPGARIVGALSQQLRFIRSGMADVIVVDEQCIRTDVLREAMKTGAPLIVTNAKNLQGLADRTKDDPEEIVRSLVDGKEPGAAILDPDKVGEVAVRVAMEIAPSRKSSMKLPDRASLIEVAKTCTGCFSCMRACPNDREITTAVTAAASGDLAPLAALYDACIGCGRCGGACPAGLDPHDLIAGAYRLLFPAERYHIRAGRGPIQDTEIRAVGGPIVMGEIPGVVATVGCSNYPGSWNDVGSMAEEFLKRRYIVVTSGCTAISIGMYRNENGEGLYDIYPGRFDAGGLVNVGSCVSNAHISGAAVKIANIFAKRKLNSNYEEIADYVHHRVGAVGIAWGAMSQKAAAIAAGFWRLGIPVIAGPHGAKYRRMLLGRRDREEDWFVLDARSGERVYAGPVPEHLFTVAETREEAMVLVPKLCMRPNDTVKGRSIKLNHYIDLHRRFFGRMPDDLPLLVRTRADIPITMKDEVVRVLDEQGWRESDRPIPDPTLLPRLVKGGKTA